MRNLKNIGHRAIQFPEEPLAAATYDLDHIIYAFGPTADNPSITLKRINDKDEGKAVPELITSWDAPSPNPDLPHDRILDLHCFSDSRLIILVLEGGDIVVVRQEPQPGEDLIEIVGSVDAGIAAASWNPGDEVLAIATKANTLLFMTREFEGISNVTLSPEDLKVSNHVSVGWGKKETQFKGRGVAKTLRDPTVPEHIDAGILSPLDDGRVTISWRGDSQFVAVNSILEGETKRRVIRVYDREGTLQSVSEPINGLEGALSWKPSGQIIAGIQRHGDRIDVVFFERNGLRHGEFDLRLSAEECNTIGKSITLAWNADSTVLAVSLTDRVQLWTMSNYHYYLKQVIPLDDDTKQSAMVWNPEKTLSLICHCNKVLRSLAYTFDTVRGTMRSPHDIGLVASIDGCTLKVTPTRLTNIPPPMALDEIILPEPAVDVAFNETGARLAVLHASGLITFWHCDYSAKLRKLASSYEAVRLSESVSKHHYHFWRQIAFIASAKNECAVLYDSDESPKFAILNGSESVQFYQCPSRPLTLFNASDTNDLCLQNTEGQIFDMEADHLDSLTPLLKLPTPCPVVEVRKLGTSRAFGLSASGVLHIISGNTEQKSRIPGCTSFVVTPTHLIYTTSQHMLKFVHLQDGELQVPPDEPEKDERCRNVERGAKLVTVMPSAYSLVLQMPRGNLETIYPRALVLAGIRSAVNNRDYKKAFLICRTQRVDMNILHDHLPQQFMQDVGLFIKQVKKTEYIDLFLSSLTEEDVTQTIYRDTVVGQDIKSNQAESTGTPTGRSKINSICDAFLKELTKSSSSLQNVVTAHVCKSPPDLEAGLGLVSELRKQKKQEDLEQAVEHICFLADVNQLYDTALGLYDLDVALLVAQQSQKDPREYLPYLQSLHDTETVRRQFRIDNDLKRYSKALNHLHTLESFGELKEFMAKHELHSAAIELYRYDSTKTTELMKLYAGYLSSRNRYKESGIAYEFVDDYTSAYEAYRSAGLWRESLSAAGLVPLPSNDLTILAQELAAGLEEAKDYASAATIHLTHLSDLETALRNLCKAYAFSEATRLISLHSRADLLTTLLDPGLAEASGTLTELLAEMKTQLQAQVPRLADLRQKKALDPMAFLDAGVDEQVTDYPDNISLAPTDASTTGTFMTRYTKQSTGTVGTNATRKTSKNRRREERKRARGKKGTVYEEEYLVNSIGRLMERLGETKGDVEALVMGLMRRGMRERALAVEGVMVEVDEMCRACVGDVFDPSTRAAAGGVVVVNGDGYERPQGGEGVLWDAMASAGQRREAPVLKPYERLTLLAK